MNHNRSQNKNVPSRLGFLILISLRGSFDTSVLGEFKILSRVEGNLKCRGSRVKCRGSRVKCRGFNFLLKITKLVYLLR